jgi:hypothetical protein
VRASSRRRSLCCSPLTPALSFRRVLRLQPQHKCCTLGDLANRVGWKHQKAVALLEKARKVKSAAFYVAKKKSLEARRKLEAKL